MLWIGLNYSYISVTVPVEFNFMVLIIIAVFSGLYPVVLCGPGSVVRNAHDKLEVSNKRCHQSSARELGFSL